MENKKDDIYRKYFGGTLKENITNNNVGRQLFLLSK